MLNYNNLHKAMKYTYKNNRHKPGFTLVEMLIVAPIVLLVIGIFISTIINMTGGVIANRGEGSLAYSIQGALDSIDRDVRVSGGYLATNSIALQAGQGYNAVSGNTSDTTTFHNVSSSAEDILILNSYATTVNPLSASSQYIYIANRPNACSSASVSQNAKMMTNIIYFVKNGTLWRRVVMQSGYATAGCGVPWQKPSCNPDVSATFCKVQDTKLVDGIQTGGFDVKYYTKTDFSNEIAGASDSSLSDSVRQTALTTASTVNVTISASASVAGRSVNKSGQIRSTSSNDNVSSRVAIQPTDQTVNSGSNTSFNSVSSVADATVQWQLSTDFGSNWSNISGATSTTLNLNSVTTDMDGYKYRAVFTTSYDTVISNTARLTVNLLSWTSLAMQSGWNNYNNGYQTAGYRKTTSGVVQLKGLINYTGTLTAGTTIGILPPAFRPAHPMLFLSSTYPNTSGRVDVYPDGYVIFVSGSANWISLDNIHFVANNGRYTETLIDSFKNGWSNYGDICGSHPVYNWGPASYIVDDLSRVNLQGLVRPGTKGDRVQIFDMPTNLLPAKYMHVSSYANGFGAFGIDRSDGGTSIGDKGLGSAYTSTDVMYYPNSYSSWSSLELVNSWVWYDGGGGEFSTPQYTKGADGLVSIKGLIRSGSTTSNVPMATLPAGYRPAARVLYGGYSNGAYARIDIDTSGNINFMTGSNIWLSLDGITFYADQ